MKIKPSYKFSCYAFQLFLVDEAFPETLELSEYVSVLRKPPVYMEQDWQTWLGTYISEALQECNFVLLAKAHSHKPEIFDDENLELKRMIDHLLYGLLLLGVPEYTQGFSLSGANVDGEIQLRQFTKLKDYVPSDGMPLFSVGVSEARRAFNLSMQIHHINKERSSWSRMSRGLNALFRGLRQTYGDERLHQFTRALEALTKSWGGKEFARRCQTFTGPLASTQKALEEIYNIRSKVEHLESPLDVLDGTDIERIEKASLRTRQVDCLSRYAYVRVLESPELLKVYKTDESITKFFDKHIDERVRLWGDGLNISVI